MERGRLHALDVIRGIAVVVMVIVHRAHYHWFGMSSREALRSQMEGWRIPFVVLVIMLFTMAGVFYVLSGTANALSKCRRVRKAGGRTLRMILGGVAQGTFLLTLYYLYRIFLANGFTSGLGGTDPEYPIGFVNGWIRSGGSVAIRWHLLTTPGSLSLVGLSTIALTLALALLLRNGGASRTQRNCIALGVVGCAAFLAYPLLDGMADAAFTRAQSDGRFGAALLLGHATQTYGLLPNLGFVFLGAAAGIALAGRGPHPALVRRMTQGAVGSLGLALLGVVLLVAFGGGIRRDSGLTGGLAALAGLGCYLLFETWGLRLFDAAPPEARERRLARTRRLRRLGRFSLTVYVLEPLVAEVLNAGFSGLFGADWSRSLPTVLFMGALCVAAWDALLGMWQRAGFVGSLEWLLTRWVERLSGEGGGRLDVADLAPALTRAGQDAIVEL